MASKNGKNRLKLFLLLAALASGVRAQTWITLEQASSRKPPNYVPAYEGHLVNVHGVVAYRPILVRDYCHTVIEDESGHGLTLDSPESVLAGVRPGDRVQVQGVIFNRSGLPVLQPSSIRKVGMTSPPLPAKATIAELNTFKRLGTLVEVDGVIVSHGENAGGEMLLLGNPQENPLHVFLPVPDEHQRGSLLHFGIGDKVRVIGIASQYCPRAPYNRLFQVIVAGADSVTLIEHGWVVSPSAAGIVLAGLALALGLWWSRERTWPFSASASDPSTP